MSGGKSAHSFYPAPGIYHLPPFYVLQNIVFADSTILTRKNVNTQGNIEGGVYRGDLFVDDGSIYVMSITTEWQNAPKGDEGNWIKIRIN